MCDIQIIWYSDARFLLLTGQENSGQIVHYSDHHSNNDPKILRYSEHHLNNRPFDYQTTSDHLKTRLVQFSNPHCIVKKLILAKKQLFLRRTCQKGRQKPTDDRTCFYHLNVRQVQYSDRDRR